MTAVTVGVVEALPRKGHAVDSSISTYEAALRKRGVRA